MLEKIDKRYFELLILFFPQSLHLAQQEKNAIAEKFSNAQRELANASMEMDRIKRESFTKAEQDKANFNALQTEVKDLRAHFEDAT